MASSQTNPLRDLSVAIAGLVDRAAPGIVSLGRRRARSSGFVWRPDLIVTADEALPDDDTVAVTLPGGATVEAKPAGRDPSTDIAVLRVEGADLQPVELTPATVTTGALAVAVGAMDGAPTAALGLVARTSGPWRSLRGGDIDARIVLDLRLPRPAEGSLVFDADGAVIGMAVFGPRRRVLAIPVATIERVAAQLASHGRIPRGYLGVGLHPVAIEGGDGWGAMIMNLDPEGPGAAAGLHQGDIIVAWDGEPVQHIRGLLRGLGPDSVGKTIVLTLNRGDRTEEVPLTVAERPDM